MSGSIDIALNGMLGNFSIDCSFTAPSYGVTALYGPSGCGKTSILRAIAGLNHLNGKVSIGTDVWQDESQFVPIHKRPLGYVFQEASLFPHLSVRKNLIFGMPKNTKDLSPSFEEVIEFLNISHLIDRAPQNLSGGERQRVAIGRALLSKPHILMMDEPLSALDKRSRDEILPFLIRLRDRLSLPIIYITHDIYEVERLADYLVLMDKGRVIAAGPLDEIQANPDLPLANTREAAVSLDGVVHSYDKEAGLLHINVAGGIFVAPSDEKAVGQKMRIRIAANDVSLATEKPLMSSILNIMPARIITARTKGTHEVLAKLELGFEGKGVHFLSRLTHYSWQQLGLQDGMKVYAQIKGVAMIEQKNTIISSDISEPI